MHVGVFLLWTLINLEGDRLPHARGGVSPIGWLKLSGIVVFPMHVGVFPKAILVEGVDYSLPHARGGVSRYYNDTH